MSTQLQKDLLLGGEIETKLHPLLNDYYKANLKKSKPYAVYDFIDKKRKLIIEIKTRRNAYKKYFSTMIGFNKIKKFQKYALKGWTCICIFVFTDGIYFYIQDCEINPLWIKEGGRYDRGKKETKEYYYIPISNLLKLDLKDKEAYQQIIEAPQYKEIGK